MVFILKKIGEHPETYLAKNEDGSFAWNSGKHAYVEAHTFEHETEAQAHADKFGGRLLVID